MNSCMQNSKYLRLRDSDGRLLCQLYYSRFWSQAENFSLKTSDNSCLQIILSYLVLVESKEKNNEESGGVKDIIPFQTSKIF